MINDIRRFANLVSRLLENSMEHFARKMLIGKVKDDPKIYHTLEQMIRIDIFAEIELSKLIDEQD